MKTRNQNGFVDLKHERHIRKVRARALTVAIVGGVMLLCGLGGIYTSRVLQHAYSGGNWSIIAARSALHINSREDLKTKNEVALFDALVRMNHECRNTTGLVTRISTIWVLWSVVLLITGGLQLRDAHRLQHETAERGAAPAAADASSGVVLKTNEKRADPATRPAGPSHAS